MVIVLDVVSRYRRTEAVFKSYDARAGECIGCQALFESLRDMAEKYDLDLNKLLAELEAVRCKLKKKPKQIQKQ